jgi:hypothetical protein
MTSGAAGAAWGVVLAVEVLAAGSGRPPYFLLLFFLCLFFSFLLFSLSFSLSLRLPFSFSLFLFCAFLLSLLSSSPPS